MRLLKEPLLHFVMLGGLMFAAYSAFGTARQEPPDTVIRITAADADWLKEMWTRQWRRPPTDEELTGLVADQLKEEVLAREARALELDVGDTIVRRRLAQKMAFMLDDTLRVTQPTNAELRVLYDAHPDLVRTPARVSFTQVFFRREQGDGRARATLAAPCPTVPPPCWRSRETASCSATRSPIRTSRRSPTCSAPPSRKPSWRFPPGAGRARSSPAMGCIW